MHDRDSGKELREKPLNPPSAFCSFHVTSDSFHSPVHLLKQSSSFTLFNGKWTQNATFPKILRGKYHFPPSSKGYKILKRIARKASPDLNHRKKKNLFNKEDWNVLFLAKKHYHLSHLDYLSCCMLLKHFYIIPYYLCIQ